MNNLTRFFDQIVSLTLILFMLFYFHIISNFVFIILFIPLSFAMLSIGILELKKQIKV